MFSEDLEWLRPCVCSQQNMRYTSVQGFCIASPTSPPEVFNFLKANQHGKESRVLHGLATSVLHLKSHQDMTNHQMTNLQVKQTMEMPWWIIVCWSSDMTMNPCFGSFPIRIHQVELSCPLPTPNSSAICSQVLRCGCTFTPWRSTATSSVSQWNWIPSSLCPLSSGCTEKNRRMI